MRPGTEANTTELTQLTLNLCIQTGTVFQCHGGGDGHICRGFLDAFVAKQNRGDYEEQPKWKHDLAIYLLDVLEKVRSGESVDFERVMKELIQGT